MPSEVAAMIFYLACAIGIVACGLFAWALDKIRRR